MALVHTPQSTWNGGFHPDYVALCEIRVNTTVNPEPSTPRGRRRRKRWSVRGKPLRA